MTQPDISSTLAPGTVLAGKFQIEQVLGRGGMGVVVAARHIQLDERVALKFLLPEALGNAEAVARFAREARAAVKIKSEHVARVIDVGTLDTGSPYMVMEFLHGRDLGEHVRSVGPLPVEEAVEYVLQACEALAEAHALGIIHRDLKPANLFLTRRADGSASVKVLDFGISKLTSGTDSDMNMTRTSTVMGSPLYMSPEQMASSRDVDARTDVWAMGAILFELLTGRVPFLADTMPQLCAKILQERPPPLRDLRPDAPEPLANAVARALEKDPERRFSNVAQLAGALLSFGPSRGRFSVERISKVLTAAGMSDSQLEMPPSTHSSGLHDTGGTTQQAWDHASERRRGGGLWLVALAGVVLLGGGGAALAALGVFSRGEPDGVASVPEAEQGSGAATLKLAAQPETVPARPQTPAAEASAIALPTAQSAEASEPEPTAEPRPTPVRPKPPPKPRPLPKVQAQAEPAVTTQPASKVPAVDLYQDRK